MEEFKRNYKAEWRKEKETKTSRLLKIDKNLNNVFTYKLKQDNITYSEFVHTCIVRYLKGELEI
ncbi:MAG: hypothetical protein HFJ50_10210 [Clostridia bacterium]|nr:hypothetical protein [Clostridia bacterium]